MSPFDLRKTTLEDFSCESVLAWLRYYWLRYYWLRYSCPGVDVDPVPPGLSLYWSPQLLAPALLVEEQSLQMSVSELFEFLFV